MNQGIINQKFNIRSSAIVVPHNQILSSELDSKLDLPIGTIERKTGVKSRFWFDKKLESVSSLGVSAINKALERAELTISEIDYIISGGATPEQLIPTNSVLIHKLLRAPSHVTCFDIDSTCLSFMSALQVGASLLATSLKSKRVLIVNSELGSSGIDRVDIESVGLFGDAATCFILEKADKGQNCVELIYCEFATFSEGSELCKLEGGGSKFPGFEFQQENRHRYMFHMDGPGIFKQAIVNLPGFLKNFLVKNNLSIEDIDCVVPHQASLSAVSLLRKKLEIPEEKLVNVLLNYGNCLSASIPMGLSSVLELGRDIQVHQKINRGNKVLLIGTGAGITMGAALLQF